MSDDLLLTANGAPHHPGRMTIPVAQGHRCILELTKIISGKTLDSRVSSFTFCEVARKLVDQAITFRYTRVQLGNHTLSRSKTIVPMRSSQARG